MQTRSNSRNPLRLTTSTHSSPTKNFVTVMLKICTLLQSIYCERKSSLWCCWASWEANDFISVFPYFFPVLSFFLPSNTLTYKNLFVLLITIFLSQLNLLEFHDSVFSTMSWMTKFWFYSEKEWNWTKISSLYMFEYVFCTERLSAIGTYPCRL